jgi:hypothetical protein
LLPPDVGGDSSSKTYPGLSSPAQSAVNTDDERAEQRECRR